MEITIEILNPKSCDFILLIYEYIILLYRRLIKTRRIRWARNVAGIQETEMHKVLWPVKLKERDHLGDLGIEWRIILKWILNEQDGRTWTAFMWLRTGANFGLL
jgi:hypothetical protein